jgi:hypothetical protein
VGREDPACRSDSSFLWAVGSDPVARHLRSRRAVSSIVWTGQIDGENRRDRSGRPEASIMSTGEIEVVDRAGQSRGSSDRAPSLAPLGLVGCLSRPGSLEDQGFRVGRSDLLERQERRPRAAKGPLSTHKGVPCCDIIVPRSTQMTELAASEGRSERSEGPIGRRTRVDDAGRREHAIESPRSPRAIEAIDLRGRGGRARRTSSVDFPWHWAGLAERGSGSMPTAGAIPTSGEAHPTGHKPARGDVVSRGATSSRGRRPGPGSSRADRETTDLSPTSRGLARTASAGRR